MTKRYDVLVIGAGLAGSLAAVFAAGQGRSVLLVSRGAGALTIGGGTVDLLGRMPDGVTLSKAGFATPFEAMAALPELHPYRLAGADAVRAACAAFEALCARHGYPFVQRGRNTLLPTTAGTLKPSWLVPASMSMEHLGSARQVGIVGIEGLKDLYPQMVARGLEARPAFRDRTLCPVTLACPFDLRQPARDLSLLDMARFLDNDAGQRWFIERMQTLMDTDLPGIRENGVLLVPPCMGSKPSTIVLERLREALGLPLYEMAAPPPGVTGWRLNTLLRAELKRLGVDLVEQAKVEKAVVQDGRCVGVSTRQSGRERIYHGAQLVVATGGLYGEGLASSPDSVTEALFGWTLPASPAAADWSADQVYSSSSHGFASVGVTVNERFNPVAEDGSVLHDNVVVVGRTLGHYDHAVEKSGNGVALASAWAAVQRMTGRS